MMLDPLTLFSIAGLTGIAVLAFRERTKLRQSRRDLLDPCCRVLDTPTVTHGGDNFPRLEGRDRGRLVHAELIPDSMTIRRLPQLWLQVTRFEPRPRISEFAVLVRPAGTEFYSLTSHFSHHLTPPPMLPHEVLVRGSSPGAQRLLDQLGPVVAGVLADPKVKEVAVTRKGLRIVWQAAEGRRGEHLLLRQCIFDDAHVSADSLRHLLSRLDEVSASASAVNQVIAA